MAIKNIFFIYLFFGLFFAGAEAGAKESTADVALQKKFGNHSAMGQLKDIKAMLAREPSLVHSKINGKNNERPLHWASLYGDPEVIRFLIKNGAEVNFKDAQGMTPLHWAAWQGQIEAAKILLAHGAELNVKNITDHTPLDRAIYDKHADMVKYLRLLGAKKGKELPR